MPLRNTYHCEVLEGSGSLDVLQCLLQVLQLRVDLALGLLGTLHGLSLERLDSLNLLADIVLLHLEAVQLLLDVVDDVLVLKRLAVVCEVDGLGLLRENLHSAAGVVVALLEGSERRRGVTTEAEFGAKVGPVDLKGSRTLFEMLAIAECRK
jgi:hypothetical protein